MSDAREKFAAAAARQAIRGNMRGRTEPATEERKEKPMEDEKQGEPKPMIQEASSLMIQAMKDLRDNKIDTKKAQAIAQLGMGVVQAANAEVQFVKAAKMTIPGGLFGDKTKLIEGPKA